MVVGFGAGVCEGSGTDGIVVGTFIRVGLPTLITVGAGTCVSASAAGGWMTVGDCAGWPWVGMTVGRTAVSFLLPGITVGFIGLPCLCG